jgi:hypothetical protein
MNVEILSDEARAGNHRPELPERPLAREVLHPAVGCDDEPLRRQHFERLPDPAGDDLRGLDLGRAQVEDSQDDCLVGDVAQRFRVETRLRRLQREVRRETVAELAEERIAGEPVLDDVRVAEECVV